MNAKQKFRFSEESKIDLLKILGDSEESLRLIGHVQILLQHYFEDKQLDRYVFMTNAERRDKIAKIKSESEKLLASLKTLDVVYDTEYEIGEMDFYTSGKIELLEMIERAKWIQEKKPNGKTVINQTTDALKKLVESCQYALNQVGEIKPGAQTPFQVWLARFDRDCLFTYRATFRCHPAVSYDSPFVRFMEKIYAISGFPNSSIYQRVRNAMAEDKKIFEHDPEGLKSLKPRRGIHPRQKVSENR